jgi:hypothetical protein
MKLINETGQDVYYSISFPGSGDCGTIATDGVVDLPYYDNQQNVVVSFFPTGSTTSFGITVDNSGTGQQVEMLVVAE